MKDWEAEKAEEVRVAWRSSRMTSRLQVLHPGVSAKVKETLRLLTSVSHGPHNRTARRPSKRRAVATEESRRLLICVYNNPVLALWLSKR
mmetsp:Transcript_56306/g.164576  ORF Transcript_56306/g.164576 Transcript_56306/m.164576 type:complete len:90 (+) Transcript_56306:1471-1740(+)